MTGMIRIRPDSSRMSRLPSLPVDDADDHEEGGLEQRVREGVQDGGGQRDSRPHPDGGDQQAELADRGVGEQGLEVVLAQRLGGAQHGGEQPDPHQADAPPGLPGVQRGEPQQQVDA
ncbi:hypothetical protein LUW77_28490 [Streptomyces radiopugnans]|nr:hypothetical protein LUW77_28490 [Streptomyces radiopugnans]